MQRKSIALLIKAADDESGLSQSPRERPPGRTQPTLDGF